MSKKTMDNAVVAFLEAELDRQMKLTASAGTRGDRNRAKDRIAYLSDLLTRT